MDNSYVLARAVMKHQLTLFQCFCTLRHAFVLFRAYFTEMSIRIKFLMK